MVLDKVLVIKNKKFFLIVPINFLYDYFLVEHFVSLFKILYITVFKYIATILKFKQKLQ